MKFLGKIKNVNDQFNNVSYIGIVEDNGFIILCSYSKFEDSYYSFAILNCIHEDSESEIYDDCEHFIEGVERSPLIGELRIPFTYDLSRFGESNPNTMNKLLNILKEANGSKHLSCFEFNCNFDDVVVDFRHVQIVCFYIVNKHIIYVYTENDDDRDENKVILSLHGFDYIGEIENGNGWSY